MKVAPLWLVAAIQAYIDVRGNVTVYPVTIVPQTIIIRSEP